MAEEEDAAESTGPKIDCALVEYVRGIRARKWSFQFGQTYIVGRTGGCVDIEVDHASLSRKHCSLAVTLVDSELVFVAMDHGSTNGTFVNKQRLEKGVGLKKNLSEIKYLVFGECENGYKFLVKGEEASNQTKSAAATSEASEAAAPSAKEKQVDAWARAETTTSQAGKKRPSSESQGPNRKERRAAAKNPTGSGAPESKARQDKSKSGWRSQDALAMAERVAAKMGTKQPKGGEADLKIDWPEDWK
eukprot:TRINITY_DN43176_c0_g1_i1.p1 TRINITY_DN43176_c0_g1~~TRINITY_DN43176_c0_g1_i1.p1  ORF type:complete len:247 (-),score=58.72 TRINITY_DN43176_c0_g1_i1:6-746(-)